MITRKDAMYEVGEAKKVIFSDETTATEKMKAIWKLLNVNIKISLDNRLNDVRIMEKMNVDKIENKRPDMNPGTDDNGGDITTE